MDLSTASGVLWHSSAQEIDKADEGRMPRTFEVEMTHYLVGSCRAGDMVTVLGIVKVINAEQEGATLQYDWAGMAQRYMMGALGLYMQHHLDLQTI